MSTMYSLSKIMFEQSVMALGKVTEEVANAILFLASDESSAMIGQVMVIDHGANL